MYIDLIQNLLFTKFFGLEFNYLIFAKNKSHLITLKVSLKIESIFHSLLPINIQLGF